MKTECIEMPIFLENAYTQTHRQNDYSRPKETGCIKVGSCRVGTKLNDNII